MRQVREAADQADDVRLLPGGLAIRFQFFDFRNTSRVGDKSRPGNEVQSVQGAYA